MAGQCAAPPAGVMVRVRAKVRYGHGQSQGTTMVRGMFRGKVEALGSVHLHLWVRAMTMLMAARYAAVRVRAMVRVRVRMGQVRPWSESG